MDGFHRNYLFTKFFHTTFLLAVIIVILQITSSRAESKSYKTWGEFPEAASTLPSLEYSFEGLGAYFKFSRSFVYNSLKLDPIDVYQQVKGMKLDMKVVQELIMKNIGFVIAVVVGILFIIIFSLVGLCFCCCRNCNNCGGKRMQKHVSNTRRRIYVLLLLTTIILCITGLACTLASISQVEKNIKSVPKTIKTSVEYVNDYIDKLFEILEQMLAVDYKPILMLPHTLRNNLAIFVCLKKLPDITSNINAIDSVVAKGLGSLIDPTEKAFNDIPELVQNNSQATSKDIKNVIKKFRSTIGKYRDDTLQLKATLSQSINSTLDPGEHGLEISYEVIDKYWMAVIIPFGCLTVLIPFFQFLGIILGTCGNGDQVKPTERNSLSNCGGTCLMLSVGFMFFFGWLFMVLTTITYIPGSVLERYGCGLIRNIDTNLEKLMDAAFPDKKVFGDIVPLELNVSASDLYRRCKAGEGILEATQLDNLINDTVKDFEKQITIEDKIESISVDLSHIEIMNSDVKKWFADMKNGLDINFGNFTSELKKESTTANLTNISSILNTEANKVTSPKSTTLKQLAKDAENIDKNEVKNVTDLKDRLKKNIRLLKIESQQNLKIYNNLVSSINASEDFLKNRADSTIKKQLLNFAEHLLGIWNNFVSNILRLLNDMLSCKPAVDLFEFLAIGLVCGTVDAFNGFWFGLGWFVFFFIPGIILSVKLAKYYHRMIWSDEEDSSNIEMSFKNPGVGYASPPYFPNNKVGQM